MDETPQKKKKIMIYITEEAAERLRELEFYRRNKKSYLVEEMINEAYRRWQQEQKREDYQAKGKDKK